MSDEIIEQEDAGELAIVGESPVHESGFTSMSGTEYVLQIWETEPAGYLTFLLGVESQQIMPIAFHAPDALDEAIKTVEETAEELKNVSLDVEDEEVDSITEIE